LWLVLHHSIEPAGAPALAGHSLTIAAKAAPDICLLQRDDRWWQLMTSPEGLGRIMWIIENTLSTSLLEKA
jgi:hypothetical protein